MTAYLVTSVLRDHLSRDQCHVTTCYVTAAWRRSSPHDFSVTPGRSPICAGRSRRRGGPSPEMAAAGAAEYTAEDRLARCKLGPYYARRRGGGGSLFADGEPAARAVLVGMQVTSPGRAGRVARGRTAECGSRGALCSEESGPYAVIPH